MARINSIRLPRRLFLKRAAVVGAAVPMAGGLIAAACTEEDSGPANAATSKPEQAAGTATAVHASQDHGGAAEHEQIDHDHAAGIQQFLENQETPLTKGKGNQPLEWTMDGDVKVFNLTVDEIEWEVEPGVVEKARGYNQMIPGPIIRATEGERVRINVTNNLTESTAVHWHGLYVPFDQDGVGGLTQDPIKPGETFTYEFTLRNSGTHMYHAHHNSADQVNRGLLGAFIIDPKDPSTMPEYDREYIMVVNDTSLGFTINGKGWPATEMLTAKLGEKILIRFMNAGFMNHPLHLHGMPMRIIAKDGWPLPQPYMCDTIDVAPGNRYDAIVDCTEEGVWVFHCHVLTHAETPAGFFGMATALKVEP